MTVGQRRLGALGLLSMKVDQLRPIVGAFLTSLVKQSPNGITCFESRSVPGVSRALSVKKRGTT
jgi:hypothetical protein